MPSVDVIIATYNARKTIERAIRSALDSPFVARIIVADDASNDGTPDLVDSLFEGEPRVALLRAAANAGPAKVRNRAIESVEADHFAILDSDDFFLPQRFEGIFDGDPFDIWADNILFTNDADRAPLDLPAVEAKAEKRWLDTTAFVSGNLNTFSQRRRQLGFVKPVFRTRFFRENGFRYDELLRLGEDFILLMDMLEAGARFRLTPRCGYVAIERADSLSALHNLGDLENLLEAEARIRSRLSRGRRDAAAVFEQRFHQTKCKCNHKRALDLRRSDGLAAGLKSVTRLPLRESVDVFTAVFADKLRTVLKSGRRENETFAYYLI